MILAKLKETTRTQHEEVEAAVDVMNRMFTIEDYKALIGRFGRFYSAYEPDLPLDKLSEAGFDYAERRKLPSLAADAKALGLDEFTAFEGVPSLPTLAHVFGSLYVIEGSTLGGQVISRHLAQHLGITPENGGAFFSSYGPSVGPKWKKFGESITAYASEASDDDAIIAGAVSTFDAIRMCVGKEDISAA